MNREEKTSKQSDKEKRGEREGAGDMKIEGDINRENGDVGMTEADTMC